jgi:hypothetical protein
MMEPGALPNVNTPLKALENSQLRLMEEHLSRTLPTNNKG